MRSGARSGPDPALARATAWEFWPPWLFYAPVGLFVAALAARHGLDALAAANPGLPDGGLVGESKFDILRRLPPAVTMPAFLVREGPPEERQRAALDGVAHLGWPYPLIAKPDVGQRGIGVRRVTDATALAEYVTRHPWPVIVQRWHPGPHEAGVFYWRIPDAPAGRIFSITDKVFPVIAGDGRSTLETLITRHPRFRRQADLFLRRHAASRHVVIPAGRTVQLGAIGNHAQGTLFRDGSHLITPALEHRIDEIARSIPGFYIGRFDVRYTDADAFMAGEDLSIIELNGVSAESTNIYDPSRSLLEAYRTLFAQWRMVFGIGAANLRRGVRLPERTRIAEIVWAHLKDRRVFPVAG